MSVLELPFWYFFSFPDGFRHIMSHTRRSSSSHSSSASSSPKKKVKRRSSASSDKGPTYRYMITEAIWEGKKYQKGSSRTDIRKFIIKNYDVDESKLKSNLTSNFSKMLHKGENGYACLIKHPDDDNECYKLTPEWRKEWTKKYGKKHRKAKAKKDPNHPKHPKNGYLYFTQDVRKKRQDQNPDKGFKEITNLVADEWRNLSAAKKKKYLDMAKKDRARYQSEMKVYKGQSESESSGSDSESEDKKKRKRAKRSDDEESKSHSAKKRKSRSKSKTARSYSESDSEADRKKKKSSDKPAKVEDEKKINK